MIEILIDGYWKDNGNKFSKLAVIGEDTGEDDAYFFYFDDVCNVEGDQGDFVVTSFTYESVNREREVFEKWVRSVGYVDLGRLERSGAYESEYVDLAWDAWRSAINHHKGE